MRSGHVVTLTLAATLIGTAILGARQAPAAPPAAAPAAPQGGRGGGPVKSPEVGADSRVTFRLRMPNATEAVVSVAGKRLPMQKDAQGLWSATSDPLPADIYTYSFAVDGANLNDPSNRQVQTSFGSFSSMFYVPGPKAWLPAPNVPRGAITKHTYHSTVANDDRDVWVYTPADYDARRSRPYPVLYLLHGLGDDAERWMQGGGGAHNILDNLIAAKTAVPMVMVTTLGYGTNQGPTGGRGPQNVLGYSESLLKEVMPLVDRSYNVSRNREERAIAGLSMGGAESLYVGLNNLDKFAWIGAFSSAMLLLPPAASAATAAPPAAPAPPAATGAAPAAGGRGGRGGGQAPPLDPAVFDKSFPNLTAKANSQIRMLWIVCGTADGLIGSNRQFKEWLKTKGVNFTEEEVPDMAHVWPLWRQNVTDMVPKLFQSKK